jgi:catalase
MLTGANGEEIKADLSFLTGSSVVFDAVYVPGGEKSVASLKNENEPANFLNEAYKHCKTIAASGAGVELLESAGIIQKTADNGEKIRRSAAQAGIVTTREDDVVKIAPAFVKNISQHRHWERELVI